VVAETKRLTAGLIVDQVSEAMMLDKDSIAPPPVVQLPDSHRYISGIGKMDIEVKLIIDCDRLFDDNEAKSMECI
jgi:purine-binding chemotaxis protein CheW